MGWQLLFQQNRPFSAHDGCKACLVIFEQSVIRVNEDDRSGRMQTDGQVECNSAESGDDGEYALRVAELFAGVFADALKLAIVGALGVLRFMTDHSTRKLLWQRCALGLLAWFGWSNRGIYSFQLRVDGAMFVLIRSSSKLPWAGVSCCSLRLANLFRLSNAISLASCSLTVSMRWIFLPSVST